MVPKEFEESLLLVISPKKGHALPESTAVETLASLALAWRENVHEQ